MRVNRLLASTALSTSALFTAGSAFAQPITYSWTGWYVGLNAGGSWTGIDHSVIVPGFFSFNSDGTDSSFTGGFQTGYNWQFMPNWVAGFEGDINYLRGQRSNSFARLNFQGGGGATGEDLVGQQTSKVRWLSTIRARIGYTWDRSFLYATGGLAIGGVNSSVSARATSTGGGGDQTAYSGAASSTRVGWSAGAGFEHAFTNRLSAKVEYLHFDLGSLNYNVYGAPLDPANPNGVIPLVLPTSARFSGDIFRVGLNYKLSP